MIFRILADIILIFSVLFLPWWFFVVLALAALYYFESYYEFLFLMLFSDSIYRGVGEGLLATGYIFSFLGALIFIISIYLKKKLKFYAD